MQMQCDALQDKSTRLLVEERATRVSILSNLNESCISIRLQSSSTGSSRGLYLKSISLRRADQTTSVDSGKHRARKSCHLGDGLPSLMVGLAIQRVSRRDH
ncbi:hypothetical protein FPOAC2_09573 [Fusarium poae]